MTPMDPRSSPFTNSFERYMDRVFECSEERTSLVENIVFASFLWNHWRPCFVDGTRLKNLDDCDADRNRRRIQTFQWSIQGDVRSSIFGGCFSVQVIRNQDRPCREYMSSTMRQLGFPLVEVIDETLRRSGVGQEQRHRFEHLEAARQAFNDWHHLI